MRGLRWPPTAHRLVVIGHLVGVPLDVRLHLLLVLERLLADRALVALCAVVLDPMQLQHVIVAKVPEADVAVVRLLPRVSARVHLQLLGACKALSAAVHGTFVGFFSCRRRVEINTSLIIRKWILARIWRV